MAFSAIPVGFMAGLFGIGGGLITVPVLFYIFNFIGLDQTFIMHLAIGTSFAIIIPTSISSVVTHMKYKAVDFNVVKTFGVFVILGVIFGTLFASNLKTSGECLFSSVVEHQSRKLGVVGSNPTGGSAFFCFKYYSKNI